LSDRLKLKIVFFSYFADFVAGVEWAEANGADLLSASLSYIDWVNWEDMNGETTITDRGIQPAIDRGLFIVIAGGNTGDVRRLHGLFDDFHSPHPAFV
jgi:hypothetical protein